MKFEITLKDPDGFYESVNDAVQESIAHLGLSAREEGEVADCRRKEVTDKLEKWFEYDEYVTLIVDTDTMTCIVKERK